jgi:hypothetical protein
MLKVFRLDVLLAAAHSRAVETAALYLTIDAG